MAIRDQILQAANEIAGRMQATCLISTASFQKLRNT